MAPTLRFEDEHHLRIGDCAFYFSEVHQDAPPAGELVIEKSREMIEAYLRLDHDPVPQVVIELGIRNGGSTALLNELLRPTTLVAFELARTPVAVLAEYIEQRSLDAVVRPHYGVDQADRARLREIVRREVGDRPIDLVVDDASHHYLPTLASFEVLFPLLRPGGRFVIEDWRWQHKVDALVRSTTTSGEPLPAHVRAAIQRRVAETATGEFVRPDPFSRLVMELVLARAGGEVVAELTIDEAWVVVRRGPGELDPDAFRLTDLYHDPFDQVGAPAAEI
jgi:predicted O-methyltransferase YrrM